MAITFEEDLIIIGDREVGGVKEYKYRATATRLDSDTGSRVPAKQVAWITTGDDENAQLVALRDKVGDEIAANMQEAIAQKAKIIDYKTKFHTYLTGRPDIQ